MGLADDSPVFVVEYKKDCDQLHASGSPPRATVPAAADNG
jgi:hypothetical protein